MAAKKRNLRNFKKALLSNTSFIKEENDSQIPENAVTIDKQTLAKFKLLAQHQNKTPEELINTALSHFLRLKKLQLDEALQNIKVGDDNE